MQEDHPSTIISTALRKLSGYRLRHLQRGLSAATGLCQRSRGRGAHPAGETPRRRVERAGMITWSERI